MAEQGKEELIIDAKDAVAGRLASFVAKEALKGKKVVIVNAEKAIITGNREKIIEKYRQLRDMGSTSMKTPRIPRLPDRFLKRIIRGMLPHKKARGKERKANNGRQNP